MPYQITCPSCLKSGLVRVEQVIRGSQTSRALYCGGCEHNWTLSEVAQSVPKPLPRPKLKTYRIGPRR